MDKDLKRELINTIKIERSNLEFCAENNVINGAILLEIVRVMQTYADKQLLIHGVSASFKANIQAKITELEQKLVSISKDVEMSFTEPENWKKEMHLINGKIDGLKLALNVC